MERRRAARLSSPTWVEADVSQPSIAANGVATSSPRAPALSVPAPPPNAAPEPPKEGATAPSPFPFRMHNAAATYASSVSTSMSAYEDLPGHHLLSIYNLIASSPDDSYPDTAGSIADDINFFMDNFTATEQDYSGVRDLDAFWSFQLAADYCLTYSEDSSEGEYDLTRECFVVELADGAIDDAPSDDGNNEEPPPLNHVVVPAANPAALAGSAARHTQLAQLKELETRLDEERRQTRLLCTALELERTTRGARSRAAGRVA